MINVIADRYAQALFEVGEETQTTSELYQELSELVDIFNENKDLYNFLKSPLIGREDKKNVMQNIFKNQLSNSMNNFLKLVIDKDRISAIENMKESYKSLLNDKNNILEGIEQEDIEFYETMIEDVLPSNSELAQKAHDELVKLIDYSCEKDYDMALEKWLKTIDESVLISNNKTENYNNMKKLFIEYMLNQEKNVA